MSKRTYYKQRPGKWGLLKRAQKLIPIDRPCEICGTYEKLDRHHKDRDKYNNDPANLMIVCHHDHMMIHTQAGDFKGRPRKNDDE